MRKEIIPDNSSEKESVTDWLRNFEVYIKEVSDGNEKLADIIIANERANLIDDNFINMIAAVVHDEVKKGNVTEEEAKEIFVAIKEKVAEYNELYQGGKLEYNSLNVDYEYLENGEAEQ